jgi:hypothetical protein
MFIALIWLLFRPISDRCYTLASNHSNGGSKQRLVGGMTKSHRCAVVMKHSGSDLEK